ncbi:MAG: gamma-glutamyl-gamma-aminobutyrate hydrolase family protein [Oscillospiraceae bacterium]|nr:gamma-glutamyl-gamma-aminobutyrate hydrolase family protein [Oscillospiraceae bacterium]
MKKPLIALMPLWDEKMNSYWMLPGYMDLIIKSGGVPVMLSFSDDEQSVKEIADRFDGFVFTGGDDIDPAKYGEEKIPQCGKPCVHRDSLEFALFSEAVKTDKPVLGICRGMQFLNAALGGTLYQDLPTQKPGEVCHKQPAPFDALTHSVTVEKDTLLYDIVGTEKLMVNTLHHQAADKIAPCLKVCAKADDGLVEAVYAPEKAFLLGVQWHPEMIFNHEENSIKIGKAFVDACRK